MTYLNTLLDSCPINLDEDDLAVQASFRDRYEYGVGVTDPLDVVRAVPVNRETSYNREAGEQLPKWGRLLVAMYLGDEEVFGEYKHFFVTLMKHMKGTTFPRGTAKLPASSIPSYDRIRLWSRGVRFSEPTLRWRDLDDEAVRFLGPYIDSATAEGRWVDIDPAGIHVDDLCDLLRNLSPDTRARVALDLMSEYSNAAHVADLLRVFCSARLDSRSGVAIKGSPISTPPSFNEAVEAILRESFTLSEVLVRDLQWERPSAEVLKLAAGVAGSAPLIRYWGSRNSVTFDAAVEALENAAMFSNEDVVTELIRIALTSSQSRTPEGMNRLREAAGSCVWQLAVQYASRRVEAVDFEVSPWFAQALWDAVTQRDQARLLLERTRAHVTTAELGAALNVMFENPSVIEGMNLSKVLPRDIADAMASSSSKWTSLVEGADMNPGRFMPASYITDLARVWNTPPAWYLAVVEEAFAVAQEPVAAHFLRMALLGASRSRFDAPGDKSLAAWAADLQAAAVQMNGDKAAA